MRQPKSSFLEALSGAMRTAICVQKYCSTIQYWSFYMARDLPSFRPVTQAELRQIWSNHPECRRLVLEVERYRRVIAKVDDLYKSTHQSWRHHLGGNLTALHLLQQIMTEERGRLPAAIDDDDPLP
ncbi:MAG: hypothetical protein ACRESJ_08245 [Pseudomonas sp.]|uniref:hypothetical protein n=1 Tax=Pseudomonas sp. TaxID=306 RepID=UPI003D6EC537